MPNLIRLLRAKLQTVTFREFIGALLPRRIDVLLYVGDRQTLEAPLDIPKATKGLVVERYDVRRPSGYQEVDRGLKGSRECYVVRINGMLAHYCYLAYDVLLPVQYGFDAGVPVMADSFTMPEFRGRRLQPLVLRHIVGEVLERGLGDKVYLTIEPDNIASIKGNERAGLRCLARLQGVRIGGVVFGKKVIPAQSAQAR